MTNKIGDAERNQIMGLDEYGQSKTRDAQAVGRAYRTTEPVGIITDHARSEAVSTAVMYKQYGDWRFTFPFGTKREAESHIQLYLDRPEKDYITEIRFVPMTEEWIESLELWEKKNG